MATVNRRVETSVQQLCAWYGDGRDGSSPSADQWSRILERPSDRPITLINFFKLRELADYSEESPESGGGLTGEQAFSRYSAVSMPTMERVGGRFLLVGPFEGMFLGADEDWDLIAIGSYPGLESFMGLYTDADYRAVFRHRTAACERQKVVVCSG